MEKKVVKVTRVTLTAVFKYVKNQWLQTNSKWIEAVC